MKKVIIYPGRFQPMLSHHAQVFDQLNALYNDADVYIATSDKVEPGKSPFNFEEKKKIIASHGIDPSKILYARSPYNWEELAQYVSDVENTVIYFAVGEKDMESNPRFRFDNIDDKGINQKIKGGATYYQMINTYKDEPLPMNQRGYILKVPTISTEEEVASASAFRKAISTAPDKESAKLIFNKQFKQFDNNVFELVYNKLKGEKMSEDLNIMKQLAGLEVSEGAPIEFEDQVSVKDIKFAEVSKSSSKLSIANRFPQGADVNDMDAKKEMYVKELMKSPVALLSEINERIMPDENGLAVSTKLNKIIDGMREGSITDLEAEDKGFVMDLVKHSLKNMELEAGDDREFDPETSSLESIQLDDIRSDYNIEENKVKDMAMDQADTFYDKVSSIADETNDIQKAIVDSWNDEEENPPVWALDSAAQDILADAGLIEPESDESDLKEESAGEYSYSLEYNGEENGYSKHILTITNPEGETKEIADDFTYFDVEGDELQAELESWFHKGMGVADASVNEAVNEDQDMFNDLRIDDNTYISDGNKELTHDEVGPGFYTLGYDRDGRCFEMSKTSKENAKDNITGYGEYKVSDADITDFDGARYYYNENVSSDGGVLHIKSLSGVKAVSENEDNCPKCGEKRHKLKACASCGCSESFDPAMEPTKKEQIMSNIADGDFETAGALLGTDGPSIIQDWGEYCGDRGLDQKDALEDIDHIENFYDEMLTGGDDKYYPAEMESADAFESAMIDLKKLAGLY